MGKASSSKKVARAAKAGGGPSRRQKNISWSFYGTLAGITAVGLAVLGVSLSSVKTDAVPPTLQDHWHAAYGIYVCNTYLDPINGEGLPDITGIHAHAEGLIHIHPFTSAVTGKRATLDKFEESVNFKITEKEMKLPDKEQPYKNGDTCTVDGAKKKATVRVFTWTERVGDGSSAKKLDKAVRVLGDPGDIRLYQGQILAFAFVPDGVVPPIPPTEAALAAPSDLIAPTTTAAAGATTTTVAGATTTTVAGATTTTVAGGGCSTTAPAGATTTAPASATTATTAATATTATATTATTGPTTTVA